MDSTGVITYPIDDGESLTTAVINALAQAKGCDPIELSPPLATVIDPDALERLFDTVRHVGAPVELTFNYDDHRVVISPDLTVEVFPSEPADTN